MLLHSILGVGTHSFPMKKEQMPKLAALTTADEFAHTAAFPSVLRLLLARELLPALRAQAAGGAARVRSLKFHRVIDNAPIEFDSEQLFAQLNYQLIHLLDFLPVHDGAPTPTTSSSRRARPCQPSDRVPEPQRVLAVCPPCAQIFADLHDFLRGVGKLGHVNFDNKEPGSPADAHLARRLDRSTLLTHREIAKAGAPLLPADRARKVRAGVIEGPSGAREPSPKETVWTAACEPRASGAVEI